MKYKGLLLDIDHTIYNYNTAHQAALKSVFEYCSDVLQIDKEQYENAYSKARKRVHIDLSTTAASHNRLLYFQKMLELLNVSSLKYSIILYNLYWDTFLDNMELFDGITGALEKYQNRICLVTDLTAHIQFRKVRQLNLDKYVDLMVTSEEAGKEKPHPYMFQMALNKLNLNPSDVCMIGDNFAKDNIGASNMGIQSIWINHDNKVKDYDHCLIQEVKSVNEIIKLI